MRNDLLLKLADMLEEDANNPTGLQFNMGCVVEYKEGEDVEILVKELPEGKPPIAMNCHTQACAMGLAMLSGQFDRLSYVVQHDREFSGVDIISTVDGKPIPYDDAATLIFDIDHIQAQYLFSPAYYYNGAPTTGAAGEQYVANRIRTFVAGGGALPSELE